jgi:hypothetical protein
LLRALALTSGRRHYWHSMDETTAAVQPPPLSGRRVFLRPVLVSDYDAILLAELSEPLAHRWRHRGSTPRPEEFAQRLWNGVLAQFLVCRATDLQPIGLVLSYGADLRASHVHLAATKFDANDQSPLLLYGLTLFVNYLFVHWGFRKLYVEVPEFNAGQFGSGSGRLMTEEGRLREHLFFDGRYWDQVVYAVYRSDWDERSKDWLRVIVGDSPVVAPNG